MSYNGYPNYETWNVALWLDNDESDQAFWIAATQEIWDEAKPTSVFSRSESARLALANGLRETIEDQTPTLEGIYSDLLGAALQEVIWSHIADNWLGELTDEYEAIDAEVSKR